jgi:nitrogen regulatory protein P-II 1
MARRPLTARALLCWQRDKIEPGCLSSSSAPHGAGGLDLESTAMTGNATERKVLLKKIEAAIRPHRIDEVQDRLRKAGVNGMTIVEIRGFGRTGGKPEVYRGSSYVVDFVPKLHVEVVVPDELTASVVEALTQGARTGKIGDGKIFVTPVDEVARIRTGERNEDAI